MDGTSRLLVSAENAGASVFVHISAAGIIIDEAGTPVRNADDRAPTFPNHFSAYLGSKTRAEAIVLAANKPGFRTLALRPPALWGRGDAFSRALPQAISSGQFAFINRGDYAFDTCYVDKVVEASTPSLLIFVITPGELEEYFLAWQDLRQLPVPHQLAELARPFGLTFLPPGA